MEQASRRKLDDRAVRHAFLQRHFAEAIEGADEAAERGDLTAARRCLANARTLKGCLVRMGVGGPETRTDATRLDVDAIVQAARSTVASATGRSTVSSAPRRLSKKKIRKRAEKMDRNWRNVGPVREW